LLIPCFFRPKPIISAIILFIASFLIWVFFHQPNTIQVFKDTRMQQVVCSTEAVLIFTGDISFSRDVAKAIKQDGYTYPILKVAAYLNNSDAVIGNLESPITAGRPIETQELLLRSDPGVEKILQMANIKVLSLANNHILVWGVKGLHDTVRFLDKASIKYCGAGKTSTETYFPVYLKINGIKFAFFSLVDETLILPRSKGQELVAIASAKRLSKIIANIKNAKSNSDFVTICLHAGEEYKSQPNQAQITLAHQLIDAGADLVIGHHPHVVQTHEVYKGKHIYYSLGNFIFDQMWSQDTRQGIIIRATFSKNKIEQIDMLPIYHEKVAQPVIRNFKTQTIDTDNNLLDEKYVLKDGKIKVKEGYKIIWQSPTEWWIDDFAIAASTDDKELKLNLSVWVAGKYGPSKPFWVKKDDKIIGNHLYVFAKKGASMRAVWQSSRLAQPNLSIQFKDIDNDQQDELLAIEGNYNSAKRSNNFTIWKWKEWGFYKTFPHFAK